MNKRIKKVMRKISLILLAVLGICGIVPSVNVAAESNETLIIGVTTEPYSLNPFYAPITTEQWVQKFIYDTMLDQVGSIDFQPRLAEFEQKESDLIEIRVKEDANWSDGEPITAYDVAYTLNMIADPDVVTTEARNILMIEGTTDNGKLEEGLDELSGVNVTSDKTLEIKTKRPVDINYIQELLGTRVRIAPKHIFEGIDKEAIQTSDQAQSPTVASGAYKLEEKLEGQYVKLGANENYHKGEPIIKEIYIKTVDTTSVITELQAGNIHMTGGRYCNMSADDVKLIEETGTYKVRTHTNPSTVYTLMNCEHPRFQDKKVRQAFTMAIDRQAILDNLCYGAGSVNATPYTPDSAYYNDTVEAYPYDPEKAKELLDEAGFDYNEPLELIVPTGGSYEDIGNLVHQYLTMIGVQVNITRVDLPTLASRIYDSDYEMGVVGVEIRHDPDLTSFAGSGQMTNYMRYSGEKMDELLAKGLEATTYEERLPIYHELQELFKEEAPGIPTVCRDFHSVQLPNLVGGISDFEPGSLANLHEWHFE